MDLKTNIKSLIDLQAIDIEAKKLDEEMGNGLGALEKKKKEIERRKNSLAILNERLEACHKRRRDLEGDVGDEFGKIKDRQTKLMNVQTNREYQSLLKEIEDGKSSNKQREDEVVLLMEETESITEKIKEETTLCSAEEKLLDEESEKIQKQAEKLQKQKEKIVKNRDAKTKNITATLMKKYEILRERRNGLAIIGATNSVCGGCNMNIPPQLFNNLLKETELLSCPTCNRMLYYVPEKKEK